MRCLDVAIGDCPFAAGNRTAFCGRCGMSSENIIIVSEDEYLKAVPKSSVAVLADSIRNLDSAGDINVVSVDALPSEHATAKFYVINTGAIDAQNVEVTFTGSDGKAETRVLSIPVFDPGLTPIDFVVPIRVKSQRAGEESVGNFTVVYSPRKGTSRSYMRRVNVLVPPPAEMHVSCELMTFSQNVRRRTFKISNLGGLPGYVKVNMRGDAPQWALSYLPNNGMGAAPANLTQYLIPAGDALTFQVDCTGQANPGRIDVSGDTINHSITLSYDGVRIQQSVNRPIYMIGIDLGTRQTSAVIRYLPLGQEPPEPVMVDLSKSGQDGEVRVETKISIGIDGSIKCATDFDINAKSFDLVIHEIKSLLYESSNEVEDADYEAWWTRNQNARRFTFLPTNDGKCALSLDQLFRGGVSIYEQLLRWTFPYLTWLKSKVRSTINLNSTIHGWPEYEESVESILWIFTVPVRDHSMDHDSGVAIGYNRYVLTLLRVMCRANWFSKNTATVNHLIDGVDECQDLNDLLKVIESEYGIRFEVESVSAISGVHNHPLSRTAFGAGLVGRSVYLIDSGGGTTDVVQISVQLDENSRRLVIQPIEIMGQDTEGKFFGGELISNALMTYIDSSDDAESIYTRQDTTESPMIRRRLFAEDTKKLRPFDLTHDHGQLSDRYTWGTLQNIKSDSYSTDWRNALNYPERFVTALVPSTVDVSDHRHISARLDSLLDAIANRFSLGAAMTDDYYVVVGGNSKFLPLLSAVQARFGTSMKQLLPTGDTSLDNLREIFVCYGSVFARDTISNETYDYPIYLTIDGRDRQIQPGAKFLDRCTTTNSKITIKLTTTRRHETLVIDTVTLQVIPNTPILTRVVATGDHINVIVNDKDVLDYAP